MASMLKSLKGMDFYRKIKRDLQLELTESSLTGAALSWTAAAVMVLLFVAELNAFLTPSSESRVALDRFDAKGDLLQINFNFTFPHLKCEYASLDATNFMGTHDAAVSQRMTKLSLDENGRVLHKHVRSASPIVHTADEVHDGSLNTWILNDDNFEQLHQRADLLVVNFYAPWCHWCKKLEPVWEKASAEFQDDRLRFGKVDCTHESSEALCLLQKVDAFPTILVFRRDEIGLTQHEMYHGERSVSALVAWANHLRGMVDDPSVKTRQVDTDGDGAHESHSGVGCMVSGLLNVQRAPGSIILQAKSEGHEFFWQTMDVSHTINHLSFGPFLAEAAWDVLPPHVASSVGSLDDHAFSSNVRVPTTHEHYIKVVRHDVTPTKLPRGMKGPVIAYGYVAHSANVQKSEEVPTVRLAYDILPIVVEIEATGEASYHFITKLCAIVGGVFTVMGIVASAVDKGVVAMRKKQQLGKLG